MLLTRRRILNMQFLHLCLEVFNNICCRMDPQIPHNQNLFNFLVEIIINAGKTAKNSINPRYNIIPGLRQSLYQTAEKSLLLFLFLLPFLCFLSSFLNICIDIYFYIYICTDISIYIDICSCIDICSRIDICSHIDICIDIFIYIDICICIHGFICMDIYICI